MMQLIERISQLSGTQRDLLRTNLLRYTGEHEAATSKFLVAYVVEQESGTLTPGELRSFLRDRLPGALVPALFRRLKSLPLLVSGKVDRRALPDPAAGEPLRGETPGGSPSTSRELALTRMWVELLGVERVGIHDNFWALGGDSLVAARLVAQVRTFFDVALSVADLFAHPTVAGLARLIDEEAPQDTAPAIEAARETRLSTAQTRHWFLQMLEPEGTAYNICDVLRVTGPLDVAALERALNDVTRRHQILRTRYRNDRGGPVPEVVPFTPAALPVTDLRASGRKVTDLIEHERREPFDLEHLPVLRWRLFRVGEDEHILLLVGHHIAVDDTGLSAFYRELSALYGAHARRRPPGLVPLPLQYADYAAWEERRVGRDLAHALDHWLERLTGAEPALRLDFPRPRRRSGRMMERSLRLGPAALGNVEERARSNGTTLFAELLAAFARVLAPRTAGGDVVIGVPFANRPHPDLEHLVGCFINPVAIRLDLSGDPSPLVLRERVRRAVAEAHRYQHIPFEKVVEALALARQGNQAPLFRAVLNYVDAPGIPELAACLTERLDIAPTTAPKYDLTLYVTRADGSLHGRLICDADLFTAETIDGFAAALIEALESA